MSSTHSRSDGSRRSTRSSSKLSVKASKRSAGESSSQSNRSKRRANEENVEREHSSPRSTRSQSQSQTHSQVANGNVSETRQSVGSQTRANTPIRDTLIGLVSDPISLSSPLYYGSTEDGISRSPSLNSFRTSGVSKLKKRFDIASESRSVRQINVTDNESEQNSQHAVPSSESNSSTHPQLVIWGTDVSINQCKRKFRRFLYYDGFEKEVLEVDEQLETCDVTPLDVYDRPEGDRPFYIRKLHELVIIGDPYININCAHIQKFDNTLYRQMVCYPQEVIPTFDMAVNEVFAELYPDGVPELERIYTRPYNVVKTSNLRFLNPENINQLVTTSGMVIRVSNIIAEMCVAFFQCSVCNYSVTVEVDRGSIGEPNACRHCNTSYSFRLVHNRSQFTDKQQIKLQESPEDMPAGQTPYTALLYVCSDLVDSVQPGERITVTGIYRASSVRVNPRQRNVKSVHRTHIDVVHIRKIENKRLYDDSYDLKLPKERIDKLIALSNMPDIYERLAYALAPSIYEHEDIKKGILLQLFGGTTKDYNLANNPTGKLRSFRSQINILLCGDPGTSKSQLLQYVYNLVPRGQYTSGKGSSAVGLTAYVTKDSDSKQMVLQSGALVLSDGGICCIDEFDKMSDSTRSVLHEVMEQQTLSIAKAGIVCQLNARTSILAAANPVESQWNKNKTIIENIQLPPTLMSRFDLIFLLLDPQDEVYDKRLARHLVSLYHRTKTDEITEHLDISLLKDYIGYARMTFHPTLSEEATQALKHAYIEMRKTGAGKGHISAYPRQLESLIRLSEAHAKMRFKNVVDLDDVEEARRMHREAIKQSATDPLSGKIDISILTTGMTSATRKKRNELSGGLKQLLKAIQTEKSGEEKFQFSYQQVFNEFKSATNLMITRDMFDDAIKSLQDEGFLTLIGTKAIRLTK